MPALRRRALVEASLFGPVRCRSIRRCTACGEIVEIGRGEDLRGLPEARGQGGVPPRRQPRGGRRRAGRRARPGDLRAPRRGRPAVARRPSPRRHRGTRVPRAERRQAAPSQRRPPRRRPPARPADAHDRPRWRTGGAAGVRRRRAPDGPAAHRVDRRRRRSSRRTSPSARSPRTSSATRPRSTSCSATTGASTRLAFGRPPDEYRSCHLVELPLPDWADALARHWLYDLAEELRWEALAGSSVDDGRRRRRAGAARGGRTTAATPTRWCAGCCDDAEAGRRVGGGDRRGCSRSPTRCGSRSPARPRRSPTASSRAASAELRDAWRARVVERRSAPSTGRRSTHPDQQAAHDDAASTSPPCTPASTRSSTSTRPPAGSHRSAEVRTPHLQHSDGAEHSDGRRSYQSGVAGSAASSETASSAATAASASSSSACCSSSPSSSPR